MRDVSREGTDKQDTHRINEDASIAGDRVEPATRALELLIDGELKLLAIYDSRQASADTRTAALATAAIALPPLILSLSKSFRSNAALLHVSYFAVVIVAIGIVLARAWNAWRRRAHDKPSEIGATETEKHATNAKANAKPSWWPRISAEGPAVKDAREKWRKYQDDTHLDQADPVRVQQLALEMWRARADDSRHVAEIKDIMSVAAALLLALALLITGILVVNAHFS